MSCWERNQGAGRLNVSLKRTAKYANVLNENVPASNISLRQCVDNLASYSDFDPISLGTLQHNDRHQTSGTPPDERFSNDTTHGAIFGHTLILQSAGNTGAGSLFFAPGQGDFVGVPVSIVSAAGYAPRYYWEIDDNIVSFPGKTEKEIIDGFDDTIDWETISTSDSTSTAFQQYLVSTEAIVKDASFANALKYTNEVSGSPNGVGNLGIAEIYSNDVGEMILIVGVGSLGVLDDFKLVVTVGWSTNIGNNSQIGYDEDDAWTIGQIVRVVSGSGNQEFDFAAGGSLGKMKLTGNLGADGSGNLLENIMNPQYNLNAGRIEMKQVISCIIQVSCHTNA